MRVLVTGASGFIGRTLCPQLLVHDHELLALVRRPGSEPAGTRPVAGDLSDTAALTGLIARERPDCVIHLAAEIASQRDAGKIDEVNVKGTQRLVDACLALAGGETGASGGADTGVGTSTSLDTGADANTGAGRGADPGAGPRLVFASTVVTGDARGALLDEDTPLPVETPYGRSKQAGERIVLSCGLPAVVVRPSHVYGAGGWYAEELIPRLRQPGRFAVIGRGTNLLDVVRVEDVAAALVLAAESAPAGSTYHVVDDEPIRFYDFMALTAGALGVGPPRRIPAPIARLVAGSNAVAAVVRSARSSNAKIKQELGWQPEYPSARLGIPDAVGRL
jgi:nucleoside-diphosphate-sugar epimerase